MLVQRSPLRRWPASLLTAAACALLLPESARAELIPRPRWEIGVGAAALTMPAYRGSSEQDVYLFPVPFAIYRGEVLKVDREKVRGIFFAWERVNLNVSLSGTAPASSDDVKAREGMPDLAATIEVGPQMDVVLSEGAGHRFEFNLPVRGVVAVDRSGLRGIGWVTNPTLNFVVTNVGREGGWELSLSGGPLWADVGMHDYYYGVSPDQATADRPAYRAQGGYSGSVLTMSVTKRYPRLWVGMFVRANLLGGAAFEGSPLLEERTGYLAGVAISWVPLQSRELVLADN